jgi:hypothetical protein
MYLPAIRRVTPVAASILAVLAAFTFAASASAGTAPPSGAPPSVRPASVGRGLGPPAPQLAASGAYICAAVAYKAGFSYASMGTNGGTYPHILVAVAVCLAESGGNPNATGQNGPTPGCPNGSKDRGLWQINDCYHPEVSNACAYQVQCNADAAWNISSRGGDWEPWSTYTSGAWKSDIGTARRAITGFVIQLQNAGSGSCLAAKKGAGGDGGVVQQWHCSTAGNYGRWRVLQTSGGRPPELQNVGSGSCLDAESGAGGDGGVVQQWHCDTAGTYGEWAVDGSGDLNTNGQADMRLPNAGSGSCLDAKEGAGGDGGVIQQWHCDTARNYGRWN